MQINSYQDFNLTVSNVDLALTKRCPLHWTFNCDSRQNYGLVYILSGYGEYIFLDRIEKASPNDIVYLEKGAHYRIRALSDAPHSFIVISFDMAQDIPLPFPTINKTNHTKRFEDLFTYIEEVHFAKGIGYKLFCRSMVEQVIYQLLTEHFHTTNASQNLHATTEYMENYFGNKIEITRLAEIAGMSISHYRRKFKEVYGIAPNEYMNRLRIEKAKDMLKSGMFTQGEIADLCGFENVYYFSRVFKKFTSLSPGAY